jgi:hypothetical protein
VLFVVALRLNGKEGLMLKLFTTAKPSKVIVKSFNQTRAFPQPLKPSRNTLLFPKFRYGRILWRWSKWI